jgi:integrase
MTRYRRVLNTLPVYHHNGLRDDLNPLPVWPTSTDSTSIVLALDRSSNLTPGAIHKIVKTVLSDVVMYLGNERLAGRDHESVNIDQLKQASAHWMRHTSATHQSLSGVSLRYIKDFLGHASFDTTLIYDHAVDEQWLSEISNFKLLTDSKKSCE